MTADCLFCRVLRREIPATMVFEDDQVVAFRDINPQAPVHILIIPKRHIATMNECRPEDEGLVGHLLCTGARLAKAEGRDATGFRLVVNTNADAGQSVFHLHCHLLGGRKMAWPPG
ncbi:MAG: histidine triad nucleotide-binding protein [Candidatus Methylomirabilales bacterium]